MKEEGRRKKIEERTKKTVKEETLWNSEFSCFFVNVGAASYHHILILQSLAYHIFGIHHNRISLDNRRYAMKQLTINNSLVRAGALDTKERAQQSLEQYLVCSRSKNLKCHD